MFSTTSALKMSSQNVSQPATLYDEGPDAETVRKGEPGHGPDHMSHPMAQAGVPIC